MSHNLARYYESYFLLMGITPTSGPITGLGMMISSQGIIVLDAGEYRNRLGRDVGTALVGGRAGGGGGGGTACCCC